MKRRDFILGATSSAGVLLLDGAKAATPCSPALIGGGPDSCTAVDAESDWLARISGPGVIWYHDFRNQGEIDQFRWTGAYGGGNDPTGAGQLSFESVTSMHRLDTDGVTGGGCLEMVRPAGSNDSNTSWWRQFNPVTGESNGRGIDDPGASGTIPLSAFTPTDRGSQTSDWTENAPRPGFYGHPDYHSGSTFDGHDFWLQMRVKMDPRRTTVGNIPTGKLTYLTITDFSLSAQEVVTYSGGIYGDYDVGSPNFHRMYIGGSPTIESLDSLNRPGQQVGSELADYPAGRYCNLGTQEEYCWAYSFGWDTLLYHVTPGHDGAEDTRMEVWAAHEGETEYTKIWDLFYATGFSGGLPKGWNALICSTYLNGTNNSEFWHRYDQIIFSRDFIPCPRV